MPHSSELQELVFDRLASATAGGASDHKWSDYVLAALKGERELSAALEGIAPTRPRRRAKNEISASPASGDIASPGSNEGPGVYLGAISVTGFRGIGPTATLKLKPGLTIVTGRNGSGKSSFAKEPPAIRALPKGTTK